MQQIWQGGAVRSGQYIGLTDQKALQPRRAGSAIDCGSICKCASTPSRLQMVSLRPPCRVNTPAGDIVQRQVAQPGGMILLACKAT